MQQPTSSPRPPPLPSPPKTSLPSLSPRGSTHRTRHIAAYAAALPQISPRTSSSDRDKAVGRQLDRLVSQIDTLMLSPDRRDGSAPRPIDVALQYLDERRNHEVAQMTKYLRDQMEDLQQQLAVATLERTQIEDIMRERHEAIRVEQQRRSDAQLAQQKAASERTLAAQAALVAQREDTIADLRATLERDAQAHASKVSVLERELAEREQRIKQQRADFEVRIADAIRQTRAQLEDEISSLTANCGCPRRHGRGS